MKELKNLYGDGLNYDNINFSDYFRSLSAEGKRQKIISDDRFAEIKMQVGEILSSLISEYNGEDSTSIMKDKASDIFDSIIYVLDLSLFSFSTHESALEYIAENDVSVIYENGMRYVKRTVLECISLLVKLKADRIYYPDASYNNLIDHEIMAYLKKYDPKFFAHNTKRIFSYNSVNGCGGYRGIINMKKMLENLCFENGFVKKYGEDTVQQICYGYCEKAGRDYNDMGHNVYSLLLCNEIFARLLGKTGIDISSFDAHEVAKMLKKYPEPEQRRFICDAANEVSDERYVQISAYKLAGHIINAVNRNELKKIVYTGDLL